MPGRISPVFSGVIRCFAAFLEGETRRMACFLLDGWGVDRRAEAKENGHETSDESDEKVFCIVGK